MSHRMNTTPAGLNKEWFHSEVAVHHKIGAQMGAFFGVMKEIDWPVLCRQKQYLVAINDQLGGNSMLDGIIELLDTFQDAAVGVEFATEEEVFGPDGCGAEPPRDQSN